MKKKEVAIETERGGGGGGGEGGGSGNNGERSRRTWVSVHFQCAYTK